MVWRTQPLCPLCPCTLPGTAKSVPVNCRVILSRCPDLNRGPTVYETVALPLSYIGGCEGEDGAGGGGARQVGQLTVRSWRSGNSLQRVPSKMESSRV